MLYHRQIWTKCSTIKQGYELLRVEWTRKILCENILTDNTDNVIFVLGQFIATHPVLQFTNRLTTAVIGSVRIVP